VITPTVGRVVLYTPAKTQDGRGDAKQPYAAIVCFVHDERAVNLVVFDHLGRPHGRQNVQLLQDADAPRDPAGEGFAQWMAYQVQVAARERAAVQHAAPEAVSAPASVTASDAPAASGAAS
jgi:hypothetical protein